MGRDRYVTKTKIILEIIKAEGGEKETEERGERKRVEGKSEKQEGTRDAPALFLSFSLSDPAKIPKAPT